MKKRDIFLVVFIIMFGLFYEFYESGEMNLFEGCYISPKRLLDKTHRITITAQEKSFSDLTYFKVENPAGEIRIEKSPDNNTVIKPVIYVYHRNREKGDKIRKKIKINYKRENKKVIVEIDNRWRFPYRRVRILFKVFVPDGVELNLDNTYGDLTIEKIASDMKIKNRHGEVGLSDIDGEIDLNVAHAKRVDIQNVSSLKMKCAHSKLYIDNVKEKTNIFSASHCRISIENGNGFNMDAGHTRIHLKGMKSNVNIKDSHSLVDVSDVVGDVKIMARHCKVKLNNIVSDYLIIKNTYRQIDMKKISGKSMDIFITHGDLTLEFEKIEERINIKNRHSDIIMTYSKSINPSFNINTTHGKIINRTNAEFNVLKERHKLSMYSMEDTPEIIINNTYGNIILRNND